MNEFRFADPGWIHLLWAVAAVAGLLVFLELRGRSVLERFVSRIMQPRLVRRASLLRRLSALAFLLLAMIVLVFALMRPQWGMSAQRAVRVDSQIMICLDVSKSMLAEDVAPNRLERAKIELDSLLGLMSEGQQVGLIAFAGKAAVLCPMTTDFGFLRLILNDVEPSSVGLGGTQIGEAIRKAVDGFRESGDINRLVLLVTDGEDHDSYPLEAAKAAKEKGVKIVSIGFGDEAGSKIEVADPRTGARSFVKDRDGQDVISRLDGETLREIALQTDGAYVPAGTGALDLESIYRTHIASMLQGSAESQMQVVRHEAYQWLVLAALVLWLIGLALAAPWNLRTKSVVAVQAAVANTARAAALVAGLTAVSAASVLLAQVPEPSPAAAPPNQSATTDARTDAAPGPAPAAKAPADSADGAGTAGETGADDTADAAVDDVAPRAAYNRALAFLTSNPPEAERYLNLARRDAGSDGELRYRTLYNLGWVEVVRVNALLKNEPEQALQHLQQAANRFREALRVRPDSAEPRRNLEIISRRILELTDSLAKKDSRDLTRRLDELIEQLRAHQGELQAIVQQAGPEVAKASADTYRPDFRRLGVNQREVIAGLQRFTDDVRKELDALNQKPDAQKAPQDRLQAGQYDNMLRFLDDGLQRLGQSRSLTRRLQGDRAFRRWSTGLADAKRARDQLRDPVELLSHILSDANELINLTGELMGAGQEPSPDQPPAPAPAWLTREYVQDLQASTLDRTKELEQVLSAAAPKGETFGPQQTPSPAPVPDANTPTPDPRTKQLLDNIPRALPLIKQAVKAYEESAQELASGSLETAQLKQAEAIAALIEASEWFFDIRRMIEAMYESEQFVGQGVHGAQPDPTRLRETFSLEAEGELGAQDIPRVLHGIAATITPIQQKNRGRATRLDQMLDFEIEQLQKSPPPPTPDPQAAAPGGTAPAGPSDEQKAQLERLQLAKQLLATIMSDLDQSLPPLEALAADSPPRDPRSSKAGVAVDSARKTLEAFGRQFFSLVEHLRDTAPRQADPNAEQTGEAAAPAAETPADQTTVAPSEPATDAPAGAAKPQPDAPPAQPAAEIPPRDPRWSEAEVAVDSALKSLEELRRLFFSLVEHLRDTAQRQADLNDETAQQSAESAEAQTPEKLGPLSSRQSQLQPIAQAIAEALREQSTQATSAAAAPQPPGKTGPAAAADPANAAAAAKTLGEAADLVTAAHGAMSAAAKQLDSQAAKFDPAAQPFKEITQQQQLALQKLAAALALLDQSQQPPPQQDPQGQNQQQDAEKQQSEDQQRQQQNMSANQLLQLIRDREAQRREDKKQQTRIPPGNVDKDW